MPRTTRRGCCTTGSSTSWREHLAESSAEAAALIALLETDRPAHVGVLLGNTPQMLRAMAGAALGGYVLCGINTTRRGAGLAADVRRAECQVLLTDADHRHLVDALDPGELDGVRVIDTSSREWADARRGSRWAHPAARGGGDGHLHDDLHLRHQR